MLKEQIKLQPLVNIGTAGHVDHGKTTLVEALTGVWAARHSEELKRGITLKIGYADTSIYKCPKLSPPHQYLTQPMLKDGKCPTCNSNAEFVRKVSFVDVPGHDMLMATMLAGATIMDGVVFVIDATQPCPQPQTREHFIALTIVGVKKMIIVQNKIDIVPKKQILKNYEQIKEFIRGTWAENSPIIPVSALHKINIDVVVDAIERVIPIPKRDIMKSPRMLVARSFDVNKPGTKPENLQGGVIGGTIIQGKFKVGDEIEIRPGIRAKKNGKEKYEPLFTKIVSLKSGEVSLKEAYPGGLIGVGTLLDPSLTKGDSLRGEVVGKPGTLPLTRYNLNLEAHLLKRVVGTKQLLKMEPIKLHEKLAINVGTATTLGSVTHLKHEFMEISLKIPVCAEDNSRVAISRQIMGRWRLIGYGIIK